MKLDRDRVRVSVPLAVEGKGAPNGSRRRPGAGRSPAEHRDRVDGRSTGVVDDRWRIRITTLGRWSVTANGQVVDDAETHAWPGRLRRSLLAFLAVHRSPAPTRELLVETFWPGTAPAAARNRLNVAVHGIRRAFRASCGEPVVVYSDGRYRFAGNVDVRVDVEELEKRVVCCRALEEDRPPGIVIAAYEEALALYGGEFLTDLPYEEWATAYRERAALAHLDALGRLSALQFDAGRYEQCEEVARRVLELDPCREDVYRRLMRCHARQGRTHLALQLYDSCERILAEQLGIRPSMATTALRERVRLAQPV